MSSEFYSRPHEMEPLWPQDRDGILQNISVEVIRRAAALGSLMHPLAREAVVEQLRQMNSYYSNLIEGHNTHPIAIERALRNDYSKDPAKRVLQLESFAHIEVQKLIERRLAEEPDTNICAPEFLCWIHKEFYTRMPPEFLEVRDDDGNAERFEPGQLRGRLVKVGNHVPPHNEAVADFLHRFSAVYNPESLKGLNKVIAVAASHHRLAWIHPFVDGNGRVTRLFTHAFLIVTKIDGHRLWTVTRGLARNKDSYLQHLTEADQHRANDVDGRGNLSAKGLFSFCEFFLKTALDQIDFMTNLLELDRLQERISAYIEKMAAIKKIDVASVHLVRDALLRGEIARGEAERITGKGERTARNIVAQLLEEGLLKSETPKGHLRFGLPTKAVGYYFPRLYPEGVEVSLN